MCDIIVGPRLSNSMAIGEGSWPWYVRNSEETPKKYSNRPSRANKFRQTGMLIDSNDHFSFCSVSEDPFIGIEDLVE
jgi:hypothetical protein